MENHLKCAEKYSAFLPFNHILLMHDTAIVGFMDVLFIEYNAFKISIVSIMITTKKLAFMCLRVVKIGKNRNNDNFKGWNDFQFLPRCQKLLCRPST